MKSHAANENNGLNIFFQRYSVVYLYTNYSPKSATLLFPTITQQLKIEERLHYRIYSCVYPTDYMIIARLCLCMQHF